MVLRDYTAGDPMKKDVKWTNLTKAEIRDKMAKKGIKISKNIIKLRYEKYCRVLAQDAFHCLPILQETEAPFDLIFIDPPYSQIEQNLSRLFDVIIEPISYNKTRIILELPGHLNPEIHGWHITRRFGSKGRNKPNALILERGH